MAGADSPTSDRSGSALGISCDEPLDGNLPAGPLIYDSGCTPVGGFHLRVAVGEGPSSPELHALTRELLLRTSIEASHPDGS